jgi:hypothetical protein
MTEQCPTCGASICAEPQASNHARTVRIDIPDHMIAAVARALMIGRNTAMMSRQPAIEEYLGTLYDKTAEQIPWPAELFGGPQWAAIAHQATQGGKVGLAVINTASAWRPKYAVAATITPENLADRSEQAFVTDAFATEAEALEKLSALRDEIERLSPMT